MLYWAGVVAVGGVAFAWLTTGPAGFGVHGVGQFVLLASFGIAGMMTFTHFLCRKKDWR